MGANVGLLTFVSSEREHKTRPKAEGAAVEVLDADKSIESSRRMSSSITEVDKCDSCPLAGFGFDVLIKARESADSFSSDGFALDISAEVRSMAVSVEEAAHEAVDFWPNRSGM